LHPIVTAACVIPSHVVSSHVFSAFFTSLHLTPCLLSFYTHTHLSSIPSARPANGPPLQKGLPRHSPRPDPPCGINNIHNTTPPMFCLYQHVTLSYIVHICPPAYCTKHKVYKKYIIYNILIYTHYPIILRRFRTLPISGSKLGHAQRPRHRTKITSACVTNSAQLMEQYFLPALVSLCLV
jgi:hypothetical protein